MIAKADPSKGDARLLAHLLHGKGNDLVRVDMQGVLATDAATAMHELRLLTADVSARQPFIHVFASPSRPLSPEQWDAYWLMFEAEFGICGQPFLQVEHHKTGAGGRTAPHMHRVYVRVLPGGRLARLSQAAPRMEKLSRIAEATFGEELQRGRYPRVVAEHLRAEGWSDVADRMEALALAQRPAPVTVSAGERQQAERLDDVAADEIWRRSWSAWQVSDNAASLVQALRRQELTVAAGDKGPVIVSGGGSVTSLRRAIANGARADGARVTKADVAARLGSHQLPSLAEVRATLPKNFKAGLAAELGAHRWLSAEQSESTSNAPEPLAASHSSVSNPQSGVSPRRLSEPAERLADAFDQRAYTPEQLAQLKELYALLTGGAAQQAQEIAEEAARNAKAKASTDAAAQAAAAVKTKVEAVARPWSPSRETVQALETIRDRWNEAQTKLPTIGRTDWRAAYKADIAGLPHELGALLAWVEKDDAQRRTIRLKEGSVIVATSTRATAKPIAGPFATVVMVAHAKRQGWTSVTITGGTPEWREEAARRCARDDVGVGNPELAAAVADEQTMVARARDVMNAWRHARMLVEWEPDDGGYRRQFVDTLKACRTDPLVRELMGRQEAEVLDADLRELWKRETLLEHDSVDMSVDEFETFMAY